MLTTVGVLIGLGVLAFVLFLMLIWSKSWPVATGKLLSSATKMVRVNGRDHYQLNVSYAFEAEGERYEARSIKFLGGGLQKSEAAALKLFEDIDQTPFIVHYCPGRPAWSYLRPNKVLMIAMLLCSVVAFSGAFLIYVMFNGI
jgi:hypothetical protein